MCQTVETVLNKHSDELRDAVPDYNLRILYDRRVEAMKDAYVFTKSFSVTDSSRLLQNVQTQIEWIHCHLSGTLSRSYEINSRPFLEEVRSLDVGANNGVKERPLSDIQGLVEGFYNFAIDSIRQHLAEARKTGGQQELIERWRARMFQCGVAGAVSSVEEAPAPPKRPPKRSAEKHWVAFQLIDDNGDPVANAMYTVTLPDGSIEEGSLDYQGLVRFDEIDPGQCQFRFPEIDAKEWK